MTAPYPIGSRVVCPNPAGRLFVGLVVDIYANGDLLVDDPARTVRASVEEVRPVMPRDQADIDKYGRYWWRGDKIGEFGLSRNYFFYAHGFDAVDPKHDWRGPVQPPPEVRS